MADLPFERHQEETGNRIFQTTKFRMRVKPVTGDWLSASDRSKHRIWCFKALTINRSEAIRHSANAVCVCGRMRFDGLDQLLNVNRLGKKRSSVDLEISVRFGPCDERCEKND
jgi:hypothetical protein